MKYINYNLILLTLFMCFNVVVNAQSSSQKNEILKELNSNRQGKGDVTIYEDESIKHILGRPMGPPRTLYYSADGDAQYYKMRGFKIQAFSGNNQRSSRDEANSKQRVIKNAFPELDTVVLFESPFWRLRVGNFETRSEANRVMEELKKQFPSFGREMYVVVDEIKVLVD